MPKMRAKMQIESVTKFAGCERIKMNAVCGSAPFGEKGESEDNTFALYTPSGTIELTINNPALAGKFQPDQKYYLDFTEAE